MQRGRNVWCKVRRKIKAIETIVEPTESSRERLGDNYGCVIDNQSKTNSDDKTVSRGD